MTTLGERYTLVTELGRGGMAVVHRAHDDRHGRDVAVKVMLPAIAEAIGPARFLREIETAARLQHPHIVPVFDSGDANGQLFFVMPLIEGESLRDVLEREGQLPVEEAMRVVREIADALEYAHGEGVIHRDLKPENILINRETGMAMGTPAYMSPELAAGESDVGPASDVYALGCILWELLTGEPVFDGPNYQAILAKHLTTDAPRVRSRRSDVPIACDEAIARALDREPARRYASAHAFGDALLATDAPGTPPSDLAGGRSMVVLPFDNLSPDADDAYLADGLTEELTADLGRINSLRVIARNSAMAAHQRTRDLKEIAQLLDVRFLLEGSVRRAGSQLRITAQLIDGTTDAHLWADKYAGTMDDVFEMQERISRSIVEELRTRLTAEDEEERAVPVTDTETYELYLRAKHMLGQSVMRLPEATPLLEEVMRRDPQFAPAYTALGTPLVLCAFFGYIEPAAAWARIQELADRGLAADPRSGPAHALLAAVTVFRDWQWDEAARLYERARELEPGAGFDHFMHAFFLSFRGDKAAGVRAAKEGRRLDPLSFMGFMTEAIMIAYAGDFDTSLPLAERPIELDPQFPEGYHIAGYIHLGRGEYEQAAARMERAVALSNRGSWPVAKLGCALHHLGRTDEARALLEELETRAESDPTVCRPAIATLHLHLGDHPAFYRWMHRAFDLRDPFALGLHGEFLWEPAYGDPEFNDLLTRVGLAPSTSSG
jgi:serine/threonine-protein kinase